MGLVDLAGVLAEDIAQGGGIINSSRDAGQPGNQPG